MKINEHCAISTAKVLLVPYEQHHVPTYHEWMKDPGLQEATASEPLTLPEEYSMQHSWRLDHDKLTFIVCRPLEAPMSQHIQPTGDDEAETMIGDINLFLYHPEDDEDGPETGSDCSALVGEIELMIARKDLQRCGFGRASLLAFLWYIHRSWNAMFREYATGAGMIARDTQVLKLSYLRVRIGKDNDRSIKLFQSLGFQPTEEGANYFGEIEMRLDPEAMHLEEQKHWSTPHVLSYRVPRVCTELAQCR